MGIEIGILCMRGVSYMNPINVILSMGELDLLFWIVCCVSENPRKDSTLDPVAASYERSMRISIHKGVVEHQEPDLLHEINLEESQNFGCCHCVRTICISIRVLDTVGELRRVNCFVRCRLESTLTDGMYARWCAAWALGRPRAYFERLPK
jgi:hypothetical protein